MKLIRIKPYNPKKQHKLRTYVFRGTVFHEQRGWYEVTDDVAEYLATVRNSESDASSPLAFDVCTQEEAQAIEEQERIKQDRAPAVAPVSVRSHSPSVSDARRAAKEAANTTLTTADLPGSEEDLESEDLAAEVAAAPVVPGAPSRRRRR